VLLEFNYDRIDIFLFLVLILIDGNKVYKLVIYKMKNLLFQILRRRKNKKVIEKKAAKRQMSGWNNNKSDTF